MTKLFCYLALVLLSSPLSAQTLKLLPESGKVRFLAKGKPGFFKINGKGKILAGAMTFHEEDNSLEGSFSVALSDLESGIGLRDEHMRKHLGGDKHPKIVYSFPRVTLGKRLNDISGEQELQAPGTLSLNGKEKPFPVQLKLSYSNSKLNGRSEFEVPLGDFEVVIPTYLGITVNKQVEVGVNFEMRENENE